MKGNFLRCIESRYSNWINSLEVEMNSKILKETNMLEQDVNGVPHVLVPRDIWDDIWAVLIYIKDTGELHE